jgi:hypothetical protein
MHDVIQSVLFPRFIWALIFQSWGEDLYCGHGNKSSGRWGCEHSRLLHVFCHAFEKATYREMGSKDDHVGSGKKHCGLYESTGCLQWNANVSFQVLRVSWILQEFKFSPKFVGCLTGHRWGTPAVLTSIDCFKLNLVCCVTDLDSREYGSKDPSRWPRGTLYPQKLALTSPTSGGRSVGMVRLRAQATEFSFLVLCDIFVTY